MIGQSKTVVGCFYIWKHPVPCLSEELEARKGKMNGNVTSGTVWVGIMCPEIDSSWLMRLVLDTRKTRTGQNMGEGTNEMEQEDKDAWHVNLMKS